MNDKILLGMKKRGFGEGNFNGFGGKVKPGEAISDAAIRECEEEAGVTVTQLEPRGVLIFTNENDATALQVHLFIVNAFTGDPHETEEMKSQWFDVTAIPYETMWPDDVHWLPRVLDGKNVRGHFHFRDDSHMLAFEVQDAYPAS